MHSSVCQLLVQREHLGRPHPQIRSRTLLPCAVPGAALPPLSRKPEAFANETIACVWIGPEAVDAPGHVATSSAQGIVVQAAWFGTVAILARWSMKTVQAVEDLVAGAHETVIATARAFGETLGAAGRDFGAAVTVLADHATVELAVVLGQAAALARWLLGLALVVAL